VQKKSGNPVLNFKLNFETEDCFAIVVYRAKETLSVISIQRVKLFPRQNIGHQISLLSKVIMSMHFKKYREIGELLH
jgi:hypothetical protein